MIAVRHLLRQRGRGYLPDKPDRRDVPFGAVAAAGGRTVVPVSMRLPMPWALDQGGTSSCVAHALAHAIGCREAYKGDPAPAAPSRLWMYYWSRFEHGAQTQDAGTYMRTACDALRRLGAPDEQYWDWRPLTRMHAQPGLAATSHAAGRRNGSYYRITETGSARGKAIQLAIAQGRPVCFGVEVTDSFCEWEGPDVIGVPSVSDPIAGGHAMMLHGYRSDGLGLQFRVQNSWGPAWRDGGGAWLTEGFLQGARDLWVIDTFRQGSKP